MAKTVRCGFCGKELTTGLFKGTAEELEVAELVYITCCADCRRAHEVQAAEEKERFGTKLENYKRSTGKKPKGQELAELYRRYVEILDKHKIKKWWWLATPFSTPKHDGASWVKCVAPSGCINISLYYAYDGGVRPFCILKSNIFVSK